MLSYDYDADKGWHDLKIVLYGPIEISPAAQGVHYGQSVFEGLKAYKRDGEVALFRPEENFKRLNNSLARLEIASSRRSRIVRGAKTIS